MCSSFCQARSETGLQATAQADADATMVSKHDTKLS